MFRVLFNLIIDFNEIVVLIVINGQNELVNCMDYFNDLRIVEVLNVFILSVVNLSSVINVMLLVKHRIIKKEAEIVTGTSMKHDYYSKEVGISYVPDVISVVDD